jgi:fatty-acyl-CoA synthase
LTRGRSSEEVVVPLAHVIGDTTVPLLTETIGANLARTVAAHARRDALIDVPNGVRLDYVGLQSEVDRLARALLAAGVHHGDRVGVWCTNRLESVLAQYAVASVGAVLVGINPAYLAGELGYVVRHADITLVLAARGHRDCDYGQMLQQAQREGWRGKYVLMDGEGWQSFLTAGELLDGNVLPDAKAGVVDGDAFCLQYTSGTTGAPKGAVITHRSALNNGRFAGRGMRLTEQDRLCVCLPFFHAFGIISTQLACTTHGAAIVISGPTFDPSAVLAAIAQERCTVLHGVPTMFISLLNHPDFAAYDLASLRTGMMGGSPCPLEVVQGAVDRMHMSELTVAFGMSELTSATTQTSVDEPLERRVSSVGRIHPHLEARVADLDDETLDVGEVGELQVRGYSRMQGYWADEDKTADALAPEGWLRTGDLATIDADGYVAVVGRLKDMVCRGGENIYPREIEEVLHGLDDVVDVHVVGVPDPKYGEELLAAVHLVPGSGLDADAIRGHCKRHLAYYKVPRHVVFTDHFPTTASGKVKKSELRDTLAPLVHAD